MFIYIFEFDKFCQEIGMPYQIKSRACFRTQEKSLVRCVFNFGSVCQDLGAQSDCWMRVTSSRYFVIIYTRLLKDNLKCLVNKQPKTEDKKK